MFFGQEKTNDILLPLITSCLDDWDLKGVFFENVVGVCNVAGPNAIKYILPSLILPEIYGYFKSLHNNNNNNNNNNRNSHFK
jgi:hypothetical protein